MGKGEVCCSCPCRTHTKKKKHERDREKEGGREICDFILCDQRVSEYLIHKVKGLTIFIRKKVAYYDQL